jgi:hypothetical protein
MAWRCFDPIPARIVAMFPEGPAFWGPEFELSPLFTDMPISALGRSDFFTQFIITFQVVDHEQLMHVDHGFIGRRLQNALTTLGRRSPMHRISDYVTGE